MIVAHDGAAWLPRVAQAVANQTRPVQRVVAVDTGSRDRSGAMLAQAFGRPAVFGMERTTGYGVAVAKALRHRAANTHIPPAGGSRDERTEWVWLLHDDCEPAPDALERLLAGAREAPAAAVLGPKVRDWSDRDVLLEAGLTIDRAGRRVTGIEPREADQGQHDGDRDVLAVSSAGMLARRDVWDEVGGFDPGMRLFREDTDFCWRVQAAGFRVRVITSAVVYHVEATARNRRQAAAAPHPRRQDRRNALLVLAGNLPAGPTLSALAGNLVLSTLRTIFFLLAKRPSAALDELAAYASVPGHPLRLLRVRRRRSAGRQAAYSRLAKDIPPGRSFRMLAEYAINTLSKSQRAEAVGSHHATDDPSDDDSLLVDTGLVQRLLTNPGVLLFLTLTVVALVAERSLLGSTPLGGGALVPAWGGASGLWQEYLQGFHPMSIGTAANTPPYVAVIAILATLLGGKPWLAVDLILLGCIPLAGVSAFLATRQVTRFVPARIVGALAYALLPVGIGAVAAGRLGTAVLLVLLPPIGVLAGRVFSGPRRRARRAAWAMALLVAVVAAFVPLFWLITVVAMGVGVLALGRRRPDRALNAAIVAVVPVVLLVPWSLDLAAHPAWLFLEAGVAQPGLATPGLAARSLLLLSPGGPGLPPYWVTAGVVLAAAAALALASGRRAPLVLAGWVVAATGLIIAALVSHLTITHAGSAGAVQAWPGPALAVAGAGLLLAVVAASDRIPGGLRARRMAERIGAGGAGPGRRGLLRAGARGRVLDLVRGDRPGPARCRARAARVRRRLLGYRPAAAHPGAPGGPWWRGDLHGAPRRRSADRLPGNRAAHRGSAGAQPGRGDPDRPRWRRRPGPGTRAGQLRHRVRAAARPDQRAPRPVARRGGRAAPGERHRGVRPVARRRHDRTGHRRRARRQGRRGAVGPGERRWREGPGRGRDADARRTGRGLVSDLERPSADAAGGARERLGAGIPAAVRRRHAVGEPQQRQPLGGGRAGGPGRARGDRPWASRSPGGRRGRGGRTRDVDELPAEEEQEELAVAGRRAGRGRDRKRDRSRGRRSARRGGLPEVAADAEDIRPRRAGPGPSRLRSAVPAGVRAGWPRRGGGQAEPESPFADEPVRRRARLRGEPEYAGEPGRPEGLVPRQPGAEDLAQTAVFGGRNGDTTGRHGHRARRDQPAGRDAARADQRRPGRKPSRGPPQASRQRPGAARPVGRRRPAGPRSRRGRRASGLRPGPWPGRLSSRRPLWCQWPDRPGRRRSAAAYRVAGILVADRPAGGARWPWRR